MNCTLEVMCSSTKYKVYTHWADV